MDELIQNGVVLKQFHVESILHNIFLLVHLINDIVLVLIILLNTLYLNFNTISFFNFRLDSLRC